MNDILKIGDQELGSRLFLGTGKFSSTATMIEAVKASGTELVTVALRRFNRDQAEDDLIWIREPFLSDPEPFDRVVVHGHTALDAPTHFGPRVDFDGGAAYGNPLVPGVFDGTDWHILHEDGRTRLEPPAI